MKINVIFALIAFAIAALAGYGFYAVNGAVMDIPLANALGGGIALFVALAGATAISSKDGSGSTMNIRLLSWVFFVLILVEQIIFCFVPFSLPPYIIVTGVFLLVYVLIAYGIGKAMQDEQEKSVPPVHAKDACPADDKRPNPVVPPVEIVTK
jgi:FtsH-binding integral membrane protein